MADLPCIKWIQQIFKISGKDILPKKLICEGFKLGSMHDAAFRCLDEKITPHLHEVKIITYRVELMNNKTVMIIECTSSDTEQQFEILYNFPQRVIPWSIC